MKGFYTALCGLMLTQIVIAQNCPPRPSAAPKLLNNDICIGQPITVLNLSNPNGNEVYYIWDWGDGSKTDTTYDLSSPVHIYERPMNDACRQPYNGFAYKIKLTAQNRSQVCLNHSTVTDAYAYFAATADFEAADACIDKPEIFFYNKSCPLNTPNTTVKWDFGDGTTSTEVSPTHRFPRTGAFDVTLTVTSLCGVSTKKLTVRVHTTPTIDIDIPNITADKTVCAPYELTVNNRSEGVVSGLWKISPATGWRFMNGTNIYSKSPVILFESNGEYTLRYEGNSPCGMRPWENAQKIIVKSKPIVALDSVSSTCTPFTLQPKGIIETDGGLPLTYQWTLANVTLDNPTNLSPGTVRINKQGTYPMTFKASNICGASEATRYLVLTDKIKITFPDLKENVCGAASPVQLKASPEGGKWRGNGVTPEGIFTPSVAGFGEHTLNYAVDLGGCGDSSKAIVTVVASLHDTMPISSLCQTNNSNSAVRLKSSDPSQRISFPEGGRWTGTGITDAAKGVFDPSVSGTGTFTLTYTYNDIFNGCTNTVTQNLTVNPTPKALIEPIPTSCANDMRQFKHSATGATKFKWLFGDGDTSTLENPRHMFKNAGDYYAKLVTTNDKGCQDTATLKLNVIAPLKADFTQNVVDGCAPLAVKFNNLNTCCTDVKYKWDFGNGKTSETINPNGEIVFDNFGTQDTQYVVKLTVAMDGCTAASTTTTITVANEPEANFGVNVSSGCSPLKVQLANVSGGSPRKFRWDFGNGRTSTEQNPDIQSFTGVGTTPKEYMIQLVVSNACAEDTAYQKVVVKPSDVKAFFGLDKMEGCAPLTVNVSGAVTSTASVQYVLGDGTVSNQKSLTHTFNTPGTYKIKQMVSGLCGQDSLERIVYAWDTPSAKFTAAQSDGCKDRTVKFTQANTQKVDVQWDMGDGTLLKVYNPQHNYGRKGDFMVKLDIQDMTHGCKNQDSLLVQVRSPISFEIDSVRHSACYDVNTGAIVIERHNVLNATGTLEFSLNDSTFTKDISLTGVFSNLEGRRWHTVWVRDKQGCMDTASVYINGFPPLAIDAGRDREIELGDSTHTAVITNAYKLLNIEWTNGATVSCDTCADVWLKPTESTTYRVRATAPEGCSAETFVTVHVVSNHRVFVPNAFSPNMDGSNDYFYPYVSRHVKTIKKFQVFTRWGEMVYEKRNFMTHNTSNNATEGWDGQFRGDGAQAAVYVWLMEVELLNGNVELYKGDVTLIR
jgi:gliding motility-associated-like protein